MNRPRRTARTSASQRKNLQNDEDEEPSQSSPQNASTSMQVPNDVQDHLINDVVKFALISDGKKLPIKRLDINKLILKEYARSFNAIMVAAKKRLKEVFAMDLIELPSRRGCYIIVNNLKLAKENPHLTWSDEDYMKHQLLVMVLAMIFMNENMIYEEDLMKSLERLDISAHVASQQFGDVGKVLKQEFVRQLYLDFSYVKDSDPPQVEVRWGERAKLEVSEREILEYVCEVFGNTSPEQWSSQYRQVTDGESRRQRAQ